jgi:exopolysaccharide biosynthesis polyprenyl glycosylphosphotransferase
LLVFNFDLAIVAYGNDFVAIRSVMMDYATTFSDYAELDNAAWRKASRRWEMFPPAVSLGTIVNVSVALQIAGLWCIFAFSLGVGARNHAWLEHALTGLPLAALIGLYWYASRLVSPDLTVENGRRAISVPLRSAAAAALAIFLISSLKYRSGTDAVCAGLIAGASVLLFAIGARRATQKFLRHVVWRQRLACDIIVAGEAGAMRSFIRQMRDHHAAVRICAAFTLSPNAAPGEIEGIPMLGGISDLLSYHAHFPKPRVVIVDPAERLDLDKILAPLRMQPLHVLALSEPLGAGDTGACICAAGVPGVKLTPLLTPPLRPVDHFLKGTFDRLAGLVALILFAPVMLACAAMIKLTSPGPVLYRQKRIGYRNNMFGVYKFRSMHLSDCNKLALTQRGDSRVFAFGRLMRRLSLDELPQLFNVIRGDMSLVGPRPHMREAKAGEHLYYNVVPDYASRHRVKPGITGWAQVNGWRGPTETDHAIRVRVEHDLYYIENWSFWFDLKILFRTVAGGFSGSNAF